MPRIVVTGIRDIDRKLRALGPKVANRVVRRALRNAAKMVRAEVQANAPEGEARDLVRSVKVRAGKRSRNKISMQVGYDKSNFTNPKFVPAFVEYGTSRQPAQGFMRRAYEGKQDAARRQVEAEIRRGVEEAAR